MNYCDFIIVWVFFAGVVSAQVCSPIGQLCTRTTDCCKGCCEAHTCVDRPYSCSSDMIQQPGYSTCISYYCPPGQLCYLRPVCPPENPCPPQPSCRRVDVLINNYSDWQYRNSHERTSAQPYIHYFSILTLILSLISYMLT